MKFPAIFKLSLIALASTTIAHADWVIEQKNETAAGAGKTVMKIKGDKVITDTDLGAMGKTTVIMDTKSGDTTTLMHTQKKFLKMSGATMKGMMEQMAKATGGASMKPVATGEKEKVGEYNCEIYTVDTPMAKVKMWVATDYPNGEKLMEAQNKMAATLPGGKDMMVKGIAVKTVTDVASQGGMPAQKVTTTLVSAKEEAVPDSAFEAPKDYEEMKMPAMPGVPATK